MFIDWQDWLNLIIRWFHITAGIAWIGSSFYYTRPIKKTPIIVERIYKASEKKIAMRKP